MTQSIDQVRLRAAAEHLEQVLEYYAEYPEVRGLCESLASLIAAAKAGRILAPLDLRDIPGGWHLAEGTFRDLRDPNLERAYGNFCDGATRRLVRPGKGHPRKDGGSECPSTKRNEGLRMQPIDQIRLRAAVEQLEWVLLQHAGDTHALALL